MNRIAIAAFTLLLVLASAYSSILHAQSKAELAYFKSDVPVRNQTPKERQFAAQKGLQEVLVRISGSEALLADKGIQNAISNAQSFVLQFGYKALEVKDGEQNEQTAYKEVLSFVFSPHLVEELILNTQHPYWPTNRPATLVWLVEDSEALGRRLLSDDGETPFVESLKIFAAQKGVPLMFPLLDIDDRLAVSADDIWVFDEARIADASKKYEADVILAGRILTTSSGRMIVNWQALHADERKTYELTAETQDEITQDIVTYIAGWLSGIYAIVPTNVNETRQYIKISGVNAFKKYMHAFTYIKGLALSKYTVIAEVSNDSILIALETDVSIDKIITTLSLDKRIEPVEQSPLSGPASSWPSSQVNGVPPNKQAGSKLAPLLYRWVE